MRMLSTRVHWPRVQYRSSHRPTCHTTIAVDRPQLVPKIRLIGLVIWVALVIGLSVLYAVRPELLEPDRVVVGADGRTDFGLSVMAELYGQTLGTTDPGDYLVVAADAGWLSDNYGEIPVMGNFSGQLSDSGELLRLEDAIGNLVDQVLADRVCHRCPLAPPAPAASQFTLVQSSTTLPHWPDFIVSNPCSKSFQFNRSVITPPMSSPLWSMTVM